MNPLYKKLNTEAKKISLSDREKRLLWSNILARTSGRRIPSPYFGILLMRTSAVLLILALIGGGTAFASGDALPGDTLYPVKVAVIEPIGEAFLFSEDEKISYNESLIAKRLEEAQNLVENERLSEDTREKLERELDKRVLKAKKLAEKIEEGDFEKAERLALEFESVLLAHGDILEELADESKDDDTRTGARLLATSLREGRYYFLRGNQGIAMARKASESDLAQEQGAEATLALMSASSEESVDTSGTFSSKILEEEHGEQTIERDDRSEEARERVEKLHEDVLETFEDVREKLPEEARERIQKTLADFDERIRSADRSEFAQIARELLRLETFLKASERLKSRNITRPLFEEDDDEEDEQDDRDEDDRNEDEDEDRSGSGRDD